MTEQQIIELEKELSSASFILETLGEEPGFNGSILLIDDLSAKKIAEIINKTIEYLASQASDKVDAQRLDFLDAINKRKNENCKSNYGWKLEENCNRIALSDHNIPALSVREAIDSAMKEGK